MVVATLGAALRRRWGVFAGVLLAALLVTGLIDRVSSAPPRWTADARVRMEGPAEPLSRSVALSASALVLAFPEGRPAPEEGAREEALKQAIEQLKDESVRDRTLARVREEVEVGQAAPGVVRVRAFAAHPAAAVQSANAAAHAIAADARSRRDASMSEIERLAADLGENVDRLEAETALEEERLQERERRRDALVQAAVQVEKRVEDARARQDRTRARIRSLQAAEHRLREALPSGPEEDGLKSAVLDRLRSEMNAIRSEIALRRLSRTPEHEDYRRLTGRLAELDEEHRSELYRARANAIVGLREEVDRIEDEIGLLEERRLRHSLELHGLEEEVRKGALRREALAAARKRLTGALDDRERLGREDPAKVEEEALGAARVEARPRPSPWPIGIALGFLLALGAAALADRSDGRVRTDFDVKRALDLPTLVLAEDAAQPLVLRANPGDPLSEAYSSAAAVLRGYLKERDFRVCAVTSAGAGDGKTTAALNLATALARKGLNVALVDGDLRSPRLHELLGVENAQGLSTALLGGEIDPELAAGATELAGLRLLPAGPVADLPPELLESARMREVVLALRERHDVVILDGPPIGVAGDAATLARLADTTVWVIRSGASTRGGLGWVRHLLRNLRADVAGAILSFAPASGDRRAYRHPLESARS